MKRKVSRRLFCCICNSMAAHGSRSRSPLTSNLPGRAVCSEEMLLVSASTSLPRVAAATKRPWVGKADAGEQKFPLLARRPQSRL